MQIQNLLYHKLTDVFPSEPRDFSAWLRSNLQQLSDRLGVEISYINHEAKTGRFSCDILGDHEDGRPVIIENQFGYSNHDHLGKCLTYASGFDAKVVIWIAEQFREEHILALTWLNNNTGNEIWFFGVEVKAISIGDSAKTALFDVVVRPSGLSKAQKESKDITRNGGEETLNGKGRLYLQTFELLIDSLVQSRFTNPRKPQPFNWSSFASGYRGIVYSAVYIRGSRMRSEVYIDLGPGYKDRNKSIFDCLLSDREKIESEFGSLLQWERLDAGRASRVGILTDGDVSEDEAEQQKQVKWFRENLMKLKDVFSKRIPQALKDSNSVVQ